MYQIATAAISVSKIGTILSKQVDNMEKMIAPWKTLHSQQAFWHKWYKVRQDTVQLPDGRILDDYFVAVRNDVAVVLAVTEDFEVPLVRQYKHGARKVLLEIPGGFVDEGEQPIDAARRELREETGYIADELELLARTHDNPTKSTETLHFYLARNARKTQKQALDEYEIISVELVPLAQLRKLVLAGEIVVNGSIATIYLALERLGHLQ